MIYFDNAATSYPKPWSVRQKSCEAMQLYSFNSGRSGYKASLKTAEKIFSVREKLSAMFDCKSENIAFTKNCTESLNYAIKGSVKKGDHVVISSLEHNSVARVVQRLSDDGTIEYSVFPYGSNMQETFENFKSTVKHNTAVVVCTLASNAFGVMLPVREIGKFCRQKHIRFILDGAQGAGVYPISVNDYADILCAPGHKSLMGPMGTGLIAIKDRITLNTVIEGGTGSSSLSLVQPLGLPDRLESGTLNNSGIIGLGAGVDFINTFGMNDIYNHELELAQYVYSCLSEIKGVKLYTHYPQKQHNMPVISFNVRELSSEETALRLSENDICTRAGYHCAPLAHKHFNTLETGTVRLSFGCFNNKKECNRFINVVKKL